MNLEGPVAVTPQKSFAQSVDYDPFAGGEVSRVVPTTEPQREVWLADRLGSDASLAFNESISVRLHGALDTLALEAALQSLLDRHSALRANVGPDGTSLCILDRVPVELELHDFTGLDINARNEAVETRRRAAVETPFSLELDRLFRAELLKLQDDAHVLILTAHHVVCDGWSWGVLVRELGALYAEGIGQGGEPLPAAADFAEYAVAQAEQIDTEQQREDEAYWLSRFDGEIPVLDLPTDHPRPAHRSFASLREDCMLDEALVASLRKLGARHGTSLFATLLGSFAALLSRLTHQSRLVVGIPAAGQSLDGHDRLVGHCVNTLPLLFDLDADQPAAAVLTQAQDTLLDALDHQRYTFGTLLSQLQLARDPSRLPLISVMFNIDQAIEQQPGEFPGLAMEVESNPRTYENFELFVNAVQVRGGLKIECQYSTALFDAVTVRQWLGHWRTLLEALVDDATRPLGRLPLLDEGERRQVLDAWNDTRVDYPRDRCVHQLIEAQVARTPDATAVVFENRAMTFDALNRAANRLARHLRTLGVEPDQRVAVCAERGFDMVVALLATMKAGGAYVPVDPAYPADRIAYMLEDSRPAVLLTQQALVVRLGAVPVTTLVLDEADSAWASLDDGNLEANGLSATHLAYVIYTSGSTGRPKGAMNEHVAVVNRLLWMQDAYGLTEADAVLQKTPFSFDVSVWEFFLPLMTGARLVMARPDGHKDPAYLQQAIAQYGITTMHFVPSMLHVFLEHDTGTTSATASLRRVICSGEALPVSVAQRFHAQLPGVELHNLYGPTEAAVDVTAWHCAPDADATFIPIGRPIANTRIYILDRYGEPVPVGVSGEIHIGGVQVGRGYLDRAALTAERFVHDPFAGEPGARMYRTGDLGRWRMDGSIEYLGRNDFQVKLRGLRIELGEIEARLEAHPGVTQAVVVAREDRPGDMRLVAYVVGRNGKVPEAAQLSAHLLKSLPEYMVPSYFMAMDAIPLSPNGKIERKALPAPVADGGSRLYVAPRTPLETTIAAAMAQVLGLPDVSVEDDFFALGGHSLLAAQLVARLGRKLDIALSLRSLFDAPTVARLAALIEEREGKHIKRARIPRRADQRRAPLSLMQRRLWVLEQINPGKVTYNTPSAHRLRGPFDGVAFQHAFDEVVRRQLSLRTVIRPEGDDAVQQVLDEVDTTIPVTDLSGLPRDQREKQLHDRIAEMAVVPFNLEVGPLFRVHLFRLADEEHALFFMAHHVIWDGWSFDLFYTEMAAHYGAFINGRPSPLPPLPVTYGDFAEWHVQWMQGEELAHQVEHWKHHLSGSIEPLRLPQDYPRPAEATGEGNTHWLSLGEARTEAARVLATDCDATVFMTLLSAYVVLLHRLGGQRDIVIGLPVRNRNDEDLEPVMGFFVNMVPLRVQLDPAMSFSALVKQVKAAVIESFEYPDVPFEHLVRALGVARDPSRAPLCQAMFSFQDARQRPTQWGKLRHERIDADQGGAEQDIGLWFLETARELSGGLRYNTDIISDESARRIVDRYCTLIDSLRADPSVAIGDVQLMSDEDRSLLVAANDTALALPADTTVHALLRAQARKTPERIAVTCEGESIHYDGLQQRSDAIAAALRMRGVKAGDRVGVCLERSIDLVATLIAVWKAGAAYVPLDPDYPGERLHFMAEDARLAQVVTRGALAGPLEWPMDQVLCLDADASEIAAAPVSAHDAGVPGDAAAYVIYTSGSTGKPKGVQVPHRAVVNFLRSMQTEPGLYEGDRLLAVTTTSFDISVLELFLPLSVGAQVLLATSETAHDGELLARQLERDGVTVMQATPTTWRMLLDNGWMPRPGFKVLCGGEPLAPDLAARLASHCELWNMYGPTETTVWSTCARLETPGAPITVGRPIANTQVHVVDARGHLCAPGVEGEIVIGGLGVAAGYLDRPELTEARFVEDRWSTGLPAGARAYRTGDLGRWRMDGCLEHLGRLDHQIKLRGHRIELGEIEAALMMQPAVGRATVVAREDRPGDVRLVAYVVPLSGAAIDVTALLSALRRTLPGYMVPQHVVPLAALPLLPNGKIDRNALPIPLISMERDGPVAAPEHIDDPRTAYLAGVWSELLGVPVGPADNFFDLGGHSMLAVQMASRVARDTGVRIKLVRLMQADVSQIAADLPETTSEDRPAGLTSRLARNVKRLFGRPVASAP